MIVKDDTEVKSLQRALNSLGQDNVDAVYITGTKEPQYKIKKLCKKLKLNYSFFPWCNDFSAARNFNFSQVPPEYEWIFWFDADDVVQGANTFRKAIEMAERNNIKAVYARYLYQVELDKAGNVKNILIEHLRERLVRNDGTYKWVAPIHETLIEQVPAGKTDYQGFMIIHLTTDNNIEQAMWRNIEILQQNLIDNTADPRPAYYLAKALFDTRLPEVVKEPVGEGMGSLTMELLKVYLDTSGWAEERAQALEYVAMLYREDKKYKEAIHSFLEALYEDPKFTSIYIQLAITYVLMKDWEKAMRWVKLAGSVEIPMTTLTIQPRDYKSMLLEALYHIYLNTGQIEKCLKAAEALDELMPTDYTKERIKGIKALKRNNDMAHWIVNMARNLKETKQTDKLEKLAQAIPDEIADEPVMVDFRHEFIPSRTWDEKEIAIYCGPGWEQWSPKNVARGIGGSEEAVIYLSEELVKQGWKVTVFADPRDDVGVYNGVNYLPYYFINTKDEFNIIIAWRQIGFFDIPGLRFKKSYLWNHDLQNDLTYTPERVMRINKVMFLSNWHRENVPSLPEEKVMITSNGIKV